MGGTNSPLFGGSPEGAGDRIKCVTGTRWPTLGQPLIESYEWYTDILDLASVVEWDTLLSHGTVVCREADFVTEKLSEMQEITGIDHLLGWTRLGGLSDELAGAHVERMRDTIMPGVR